MNKQIKLCLGYSPKCPRGGRLTLNLQIKSGKWKVVECVRWELRPQGVIHNKNKVVLRLRQRLKLVELLLPEKVEIYWWIR